MILVLRNRVGNCSGRGRSNLWGCGEDSSSIRDHICHFYLICAWYILSSFLLFLIGCYRKFVRTEFILCKRTARRCELGLLNRILYLRLCSPLGLLQLRLAILILVVLLSLSILLHQYLVIYGSCQFSSSVVNGRETYDRHLPHFLAILITFINTTGNLDVSIDLLHPINAKRITRSVIHINLHPWNRSLNIVSQICTRTLSLALFTTLEDFLSVQFILLIV